MKVKKRVLFDVGGGHQEEEQDGEGGAIITDEEVEQVGRREEMR
jgi:hypothetical protein